MRNGPSTCGKTDCENCQLDRQLMCRYDIKDSVNFLVAILPSFVVMLAATIKAGFGVWLWGWLAYAVIFFFIIEPIILCRYCPYWGMPGKKLKCHANYGIIKFFKYKPGPSSRLEKVMFSITALIFFGYPLIFMIIGQEYLLTAIAVVCIFSFIFTAKHSICARCINFSCPMNSTDDKIKQLYLEQNEQMGNAYKGND